MGQVPNSQQLRGISNRLTTSQMAAETVYYLHTKRGVIERFRMNLTRQPSSFDAFN